MTMVSVKTVYKVTSSKYLINCVYLRIRHGSLPTKPKKKKKKKVLIQNTWFWSNFKPSRSNFQEGGIPSSKMIPVYFTPVWGKCTGLFPREGKGRTKQR